MFAQIFKSPIHGDILVVKVTTDEIPGLAITFEIDETSYGVCNDTVTATTDFIPTDDSFEATQAVIAELSTAMESLTLESVEKLVLLFKSEIAQHIK